MFSKSILSRQQQHGGKKWSPRQYVKNWLIGSRGLASLVSECNSVSQQNYSPTSSKRTKSGIALLASADADNVTSIVNRYQKLLVHSSSWELLSPHQILTCLGASSIPMYSDREKNLVMLQQEKGAANSSSNRKDSSSNEQPVQNEIPIFERNVDRVVEAEFAENVWSAALPSLHSFSATMTSFEAAAVVRSAHRLSCAVPPSLLQLCATRFTSEYIPDETERDAQIFEIFVQHTHRQEDQDEALLVKNAIVLMVRTAHSFSSQASLLSQQQSRHEKLSQSKSMLNMIQDIIANREEQKQVNSINNSDKNSASNNYSISSQERRKFDQKTSTSEFPSFLYTPEIVQSCSKSCAEATIALLETATGFFVSNNDANDNDNDNDETKALLERQRELLSLFSWSSLSVSIEALSLIKNYYHQREENHLTCKIARLSNILTKELIRRVESSNATATANAKISTSQHQNTNHLFSLSMIRQTYPLVKNICQNCPLPSNQENHTTNETNEIRGKHLLDEQYYACVFLANDLYVTLTHRLGSYVRKLAFAQGPEDFVEFVNCAIEMEKAAHVIQECYTIMEIDKKRRTISFETSAESNENQSSSVMDRMFSQTKETSKSEGPSSSKLHLHSQQQYQKSRHRTSAATTSYDDIFKGERHSLDGPLVVESVANYFDHVVELMKKKSSSSSFSLASYYLTSTLSRSNSSHSSASSDKNNNKKLSYYYNSNKKFGEINKLTAGGNQRFNKFYQQQFLKTFKDIDRYSLQTSVAPLCIGSLVVWCEIEEIRAPAIQILSKSLRNLSSTHLVRVCQLVPKLRSNRFIGGRVSNNIDKTVNDDEKRKSSTKDEGSSSVVDTSSLPSSSSASTTATMSESEYARFIDELLAAIYVSYKDLSTVGCCVCLRALAELSVVEKQLLSSSFALDEDNEKQEQKFTPHVLPIGALSLCVQSLTARVSELLENEAAMTMENKNNIQKENSPSSSSALSSDERINDANSVLITKGYSTKLILEHIGTSLLMLGMLPGGSVSNVNPSSSSSPPTTTSPSNDESLVDDNGKQSSSLNNKDVGCSNEEGKSKRKRGESCLAQNEVFAIQHHSNIRNRSTFKDKMKMMEM